MILGIDPKVDYAFKHLLGRESTRAILIDVINQVLNPIPGQQIQDIELLNPFNPKEALDDKLSILDIKARDQTGRQFNIEMQMLAFRYYEKRILYYWARLHQQQLHEGQDYLNSSRLFRSASWTTCCFLKYPTIICAFNFWKSHIIFRLPRTWSFTFWSYRSSPNRCRSWRAAWTFGFTFCVMPRRWIQKPCQGHFSNLWWFVQWRS